ncbi:enolase C-terminal domain-like protein [Alteribacillus sp. JSM 102045]|uniref:enolase C-terminal domain-like protein n=1 Tax=Alteribacillus sp. JSM 102045 TaxID=1562101 RepID=UPI0035C2005C
MDEDPGRVERLLQKLNRQIRGNAFAKAAVEMALFDALGKTYKVPVHQLLGGLHRAEGDIQEAKNCVSSGQYANFKTKSGKEAPEDDAKCSIRIAEGIKGYSTIGMDPNGLWDRITTMKWMDAFFDVGIDFLEQPLPPEDVEGLAHLSE